MDAIQQVFAALDIQSTRDAVISSGLLVMAIWIAVESLLLAKRLIGEFFGDGTPDYSDDMTDDEWEEYQRKGGDW